jgi:hypothetical protein
MEGNTMPGLNRRSFLRGAAAVTVVQRHVLGGPGHVAPSDRLNLAGIGIGGMGAVDLEELSSENIVALCDVDWDYAAKTFNKYPKAARYRDYRVMLEREKGIDGVIVATPDHLHAVISMAAIKAGKHVYTEKPLAYCVDEARKLAAAAREARVATQMGNQGRPPRPFARSASGSGTERSAPSARCTPGHLTQSGRKASTGPRRHPGYRRHSTGTCGSDRLRHAPTTPPICRANGEAGGTSGRAGSETWDAMFWTTPSGRSGLVTRPASRRVVRSSWPGR